MPVRIISSEYTDIYGNSTTFAKMNTGDKANLKVVVESSIRMDSLTNPLTMNFSNLEITSASLSWIDEGFRIGDTIQSTRYNPFGAVMTSWGAQIVYVDDQIMKLNQQFGWYIIANSESQSIEVLFRNRESVDVDFNLVKNGIVGSSASLIDGETTRMRFPGVYALPVGNTQNALFIGNKSGQAMGDVSVTRLADSGLATRYEFNIDFFLNGWYDEDLFENIGCLKPYVRFAWSSFENEPFAQTIRLLNNDANTGWYNEFNNTSVNNASLISSNVSAIDYVASTVFTFTIQGDINTFGMGGCYVSQDSNYYKNKVFNQRDISILGHTQPFLIPNIVSSFNNDGAGFVLVLNNTVTVGNQHTITVTFFPVGTLSDFMDEREDGDRTFYLWAKCGDCNFLLFSDQLTKQPPVGGVLTFEEKTEFFDHSQNVDSSVGFTEPVTDNFDVEDDMAFLGTFLLDRDAVYERLNLKIQAFNDISLESFNLQINSFDFSGVQSLGGVYFLNESQTINPLLPTTSLKRNAVFKREPSFDTPTQYGVSIYYPFVLRWEYWLSQSNANSYFFGNQNKKWSNYQNADWVLNFQVELIKDNLAFVYDRKFFNYDYDNQPIIDSQIELIRQSDGAVVDVILEGEIFIVRATHTLLAGMWNPPTTWGQIRCYPTESAPPFIASTAIDYDNNGSNPLSPIVGTTASITFPSVNTVVVECLFNPSLINLNSGVSFSAKIKDKNIKSPIGAKIANDDGILKFKTTSGSISEFKTLS